MEADPSIQRNDSWLKEYELSVQERNVKKKRENSEYKNRRPKIVMAGRDGGYQNEINIYISHANKFGNSHLRNKLMCVLN